ncbi:bifunctional L-alanine/L-glutamate racemase [Oceanotoga sp. DSM 15011]|uniref:bifunctional L-alanine/L-glutamate racemase n=1 Tax=Oceanotoga sp. DSM 15011 TaxID=2984951 RepID=UPI0021F4210B|nr:bifunctional L-alanine/L-glutamate racemase [Oceanotoga sp. DSM 15011]UYO99096.1 bifunctional L-alanine/L-glutamate racemase [Oceanotoga sp. DSM 15011]
MNELNTTDILHHLGENDFPFGAVNPPIYQTSIFCYKNFQDFKKAISDEPNNYIYSRGNNPTVNLLEEKIAKLEHGERAKLVSSGISAITNSILAFLKSGDHIVCVKDSYSWTKNLLEKYLPRFGVTHTYVEGTNTQEIIDAVKENTKIIYLESPTTFTFKLQNLKEISNFAKSKNIKTIIDNTWATPIYQNPIDYGIDIVVHSASKYLGGNSDVVAGIIIGKEQDIRHIFQTEFQNIGTVPDPFMAWLILRGIRTLHIRLEKHYENALKIMNFLKQHPKIENVLYPFDPDFPQYELAKKQMKGGSGLMSFKLKTNKIEKVIEFTNRINYFKRAVSWGGYESLIMPYAVTTDNISQELLPLIRIHVGLEDPQLLINDLDEALKII